MIQILTDEVNGQLLQSIFSQQSLQNLGLKSWTAPVVNVTRCLPISNPSGQQFYSVASLAGYNVEIAIGDPSALPIAGTFKLTSTTATTGLGYNATASEVQTALNALASITTAGGVTVAMPAQNFYIVTFNSVGSQPQITGDATDLAPLSIVDTGTAVDGTSTLREIQTIYVHAQPAAFATLTGAMPSAAATVTQLTAGGGGSNAQYQLTLSPYPYAGGFPVTIPQGRKTNISANSLANPTVVTTASAHGLTSGDTVTVAGSNSTPTINGSRVVTVLTSTTFSIPVNVTVAGTAGTVQAGSGTTDFISFAASDTDFQTAIENITNIGSGNVSVQKVSDGNWIFTFIGALANTDVGTITTSATALSVLSGVTGTLDLRVSAVDILLNGSDSANTTFEVQLTPAGGTPIKMQNAATILRGLITPGSASPPLIPVSTSYWSPTITDLQGGTTDKLDAVATAGIAVGYLLQFSRTGVSLVSYQLQSGTAATASPGIIRPLDYDGSTNQKIWVSV